jgi:hypothetical protein
MACREPSTCGLQVAGAGGGLPEKGQALLAHQAAVLVALLSRVQMAAASMCQREAPAARWQALAVEAELVRTVTVAIPDPDRYGGLAGGIRLPDGRSLNQGLVTGGLGRNPLCPSPNGLVSG